MRTIITNEAQLDALPAGSVVASPFPDIESNVAERTSDMLWLITGESVLMTTGELFDSADASFTVLRHGYDDEYTNVDRGIEISQRIAAIDAMLGELKRIFAKRELEGGYKAALTHPLWTQCQAERAQLQESLTLLV